MVLRLGGGGGGQCLAGTGWTAVGSRAETVGTADHQPKSGQDGALPPFQQAFKRPRSTKQITQTTEHWIPVVRHGDEPASGNIRKPTRCRFESQSAPKPKNAQATCGPCVPHKSYAPCSPPSPLSHSRTAAPWGRSFPMQSLTVCRAALRSPYARAFCVRSADALPLVAQKDWRGTSARQTVYSLKGEALVRQAPSASTVARQLLQSPLTVVWQSFVVHLLPRGYPQSVNSRYLPYTAWNVAGACVGSMSGVLSMQVCALGGHAHALGCGRAGGLECTGYAPVRQSSSGTEQGGKRQLWGLHRLSLEVPLFQWSFQQPAHTRSLPCCTCCAQVVSVGLQEQDAVHLLYSADSRRSEICLCSMSFFSLYMRAMYTVQETLSAGAA